MFCSRLYSTPGFYCFIFHECVFSSGQEIVLIGMLIVFILMSAVREGSNLYPHSPL